MHFDDYLTGLNNHLAVPQSEKDAAVNIYERLRTAVVISRTVMGDDATPQVITAVFNQVCAESRLLSPGDFELSETM